MEAWTWDDHLTLEVETLDEQHGSIMELWERVRSAGRTARLEPWRTLLAEMRTHFRFEDEWMEASGYSHKRHHMRDHVVFLAEMEAVFEDAEAGFAIDDDVLLAVRGWLTGHVKGLDRDFARFLQEREAWDLKKDWEFEEFERRTGSLTLA